MIQYLLYGVLFIVLILLGLRYYIKTTVLNGSYVTLVGKTAIVTGANTGIGYYTALDFAKRGARVILACRNEEKCEEARDNMVRATNNNNIICKLVNFESLSSIRKFCKDINENEKRVDILVNNAGAAELGNRYTEDGLQITWQTNHLSSFLLTHLLLDKLKQSAPSRIVNVASQLASFGRLKVEEINTYPNPNNVHNSDGHLYNTTKQANILFTTELATRLQGTGVIVNAVHPGYVTSNIWKKVCRKFRWLAFTLMKLIFKDCEEGAQTSIFCAVSKEVDNINGKLYDNCREINLYKTCADMEMAGKLWIASEKLVLIKDD